LVTSLYTSVKDRLSSWILLDSDSRYYLACSVKAPIAGHVCAVIGQTPLAASYLISTLLVFHLAAHFNVEVSSRDTGRAHTWATCGMVCRRKHRKSAFSWPVSRLSFSWPFDQPDSRDDTEARLAPPMAVHTCLPACSCCCVGILHVSDRRFLHSSRAHNYTERPLEARFIHGLWSAGIAERHLEGAPKRRGNARHPTTASRLARSASEGQP
jgi:hypothetical protein